MYPREITVYWPSSARKFIFHVSNGTLAGYEFRACGNILSNGLARLTSFFYDAAVPQSMTIVRCVTCVSTDTFVVFVCVTES